MLTVLVVLYDIEFMDSITLNTLYRLNLAGKLSNQCNLVIHNNGPRSLKDKFNTCSLVLNLREQFCQVSFKEDKNNSALSHVYNDLGKESSCLILDQDTTITLGYISSLESFMKTKEELLIPIVKVGSTFCYPKEKGKIVINMKEGIRPLNKVISIMSGTCIKPSLIDKLEQKFITTFDDRFAFYGVDTTFFLRCRRVKLKQYYLAAAIKHDLSSVTESELSNFRLEERLIDSVLQLRVYPSLGAIKGALLFMMSINKIRLLKHAKLLFKVFLIGKHPRLWDRNEK
ncbi:hypothetical protein [Pseudoalteromonas sp. CAL260-MNA-CIBAN-0059]|uniref:hypothetical protein n=1 Tax=Pseudoalteromonas sp. CAL260-MNA-CIBAN-0059 TaxID=3140430 RepID=UPI0033199C8D